MCPDPKYSEPFFWWGPGWDSRPDPQIGALLRDGAIDPWSGAVLWAALARRHSLAVIAGPSGAGKTTLLTALLEFLPPDTRRIYPRGCFESFAFLTDPEVVPTKTALLVNEMSPHLPVYLWGAAVSRLLDAADRGFALLATAHAETVAEFVGSLTGSPLRIPAMRVGAFEFVAVLEPSAECLSGRRLRGVWRLRRGRDGVGIEQLACHLLCDVAKQRNSHQQINSMIPFPTSELLWRGRVLDDLRAGTIQQLPTPRWPPEPDCQSWEP